MRIFLTIVACVGVALLALGTVLASMSTRAYLQAPEFAWSHPGMYFEWTPLGFLSGFASGFAGAAFALIGGLMGGPRHIWVALMAAGLIYCLPFIVGSVYAAHKHQAYPDQYPGASYAEVFESLVYLIPGIVVVVEGLAIRKPELDSAK